MSPGSHVFMPAATNARHPRRVLSPGKEKSTAVPVFSLFRGTRTILGCLYFQTYQTEMAVERPRCSYLAYGPFVFRSPAHPGPRVPLTGETRRIILMHKKILVF